MFQDGIVLFDKATEDTTRLYDMVCRRMGYRKHVDYLVLDTCDYTYTRGTWNLASLMTCNIDEEDEPKFDSPNCTFDFYNPWCGEPDKVAGNLYGYLRHQSTILACEPLPGLKTALQHICHLPTQNFACQLKAASISYQVYYLL